MKSRHSTGDFRFGRLARPAALMALVVLCACASTPEPPPPWPRPADEAPPASEPASPPPEEVAAEPDPDPPAPRSAEPAPEPEAPVAEPLPDPDPSAPIEKVEPEPSIDLDDLTKRLKKTSAIGIFTKLKLKNELDDLIEDVSEHYESGSSDLSALRQRFELLVMKVLSVLKNGDPALSRDLSASRSALWARLADPAAHKKS